ncbi:uncharacterized protein BT62DRAFT_1007860 [Guyanagaster necrorhizus]|uniref:DUF4604 domain-containing protein n=1 Tax=Guyanagaster necrorhizus TaxID=856835 RepID=A0A9P7VQ44_9AGAR|nr:uncharacterized protein BT62DRAFT_1007860 [Guyanagaster necrorhizus MCA 3950]KAG7444834.1 hypothetical protein BT62DRAFT_1007860 [Guyanagaster necrorhizus MCA 3950]
MAPKEPTRAQLSSRLSYSQHTPAFLQKLQNRIAGIPDSDHEDDDEWEYDGSGRPPIPRRPAIPERPESQPGSEDEDDRDEKPQVVVLKEGKHLTEREAENVRRQEKGLSPLPPDSTVDTEVHAVDPTPKESAIAKGKKSAPSLSFSSSKAAATKSSASKRKRIGGLEDASLSSKAPSKKKAKKAAKSKTLLSFGDDA